MAKRKMKLTRILSIDGGGIRGIVPGQVLVWLEEKLKNKSGNPDARIADYFDLLAGTSTGGILICAYLCPDKKKAYRPRYTANEVVDLYLKRGNEIFDIPVYQKIKSADGILDEKYPAFNLENALKQYFGDTKLSQLLKPCLISSYDIEKRQAHFFTQQDAVVKNGWDYLVRDLARATSAAPTYFECSMIKSQTDISYPLIDGGVFCNNPALCAYAEAHHQYKVRAHQMAILSLGTGFVKKPYEYELAKNYGMIGWIKPLIDIMMSGVSETIDYQLKEIFDAVKRPAQYLRINSEIPIRVNPEMDDASPDNLKALKELGNETAQKFESQLDSFIELLL